MIICGIELKSSEAIVALIASENGDISFRDIEPKKIKLADDENKEAVRSFYDTFSAFIKSHHIELIAIKKRAKKGTYAGGAISFKIEGIIQLCADIDIELISPQAVSSSNKKNKVEIPDKLNQYQEQAFLTACCAASKIA